MSGYKFNILTY